MVSLPAPLARELLAASPVRLSLKAVPIRFSMLISRSLPAARVFWALPWRARETFTPVARVS
jgi:hypothetical protein